MVKTFSSFPPQIKRTRVGSKISYISGFNMTKKHTKKSDFLSSFQQKRTRNVSKQFLVSTIQNNSITPSQQQTKMRTSKLFILSYQAAALFGAVGAFMTPTSLTSPNTCVHSTAVDDETIPTNLPSDCGMDYIPLATMLATEQFEEADQFTRDALIEISGSKEKGRDFVYFTDVKRIPNTDLATIERLWNKYSKGKFGYSVQKVSKIEIISGHSITK